MDADIILAVASGTGQAAIVQDAAQRLGQLRYSHIAVRPGAPPPRRASLCRLRDADGAELDQ